MLCGLLCGLLDHSPLHAQLPGVYGLPVAWFCVQHVGGPSRVLRPDGSYLYVYCLWGHTAHMSCLPLHAAASSSLLVLFGLQVLTVIQQAVSALTTDGTPAMNQANVIKAVAGCLCEHFRYSDTSKFNPISAKLT